MSNLAEAWQDLIDVKFSIAGSESNPHLVQIVAPNEVVVVLGFEIKIGARAGTMSICIPFNVIEPIIGKLGTQSWNAYSHKGGTSDEARSVSQNLRHAKVQARTFLGQTQLTVGEILSLAPGDIIRLNKLVNRDFVLQIEDRNKFAGRIGQLRGNRALQITREAEPDELL